MAELCQCGDPECKASTVQVYKSLERLACYERTIRRQHDEICRLNFALGVARGQLKVAEWFASPSAGPAHEPRNEGHKPGTEGRE